MTKRKQSKPHTNLESRLRSWLMLQPPEEDAPIQITSALRLIGASRSPYLLRDLISQGRFGDKLGRSLLTLVSESGRAASDSEFRLVHQSDGYLYAVYSLSRGGQQRIAVLGFQRCGAVTEADKNEAWRLLGLAEKLVRELARC
jgi:hypothetical protein